ncbi:MAG: NAD-dependent epimerase/dehydratase family protein, partial [Candidatus Neomarinimicrobiota bacterium]|nr:NAD-dependent epimerase/dehydratase family protein [Candidatus Neomarinimicrobiota bacterium]
MKTAFVTGASGHLGANLVRRLIKSGWNVRCLIHRDTEALLGLDIEQVHGDLSSVSILSKHMKGCGVVFHLAACVGIENVNKKLMKKINIVGTKNMCEAALNSNIKRFIHFSTIHAFNQHPINETLNEDRPLVNGPRSPMYDQTKAIAQTIVYDACKKGLNASILHPTGVLGPFDYKP